MTSPEDPFDTSEWRNFAKCALGDLVPKLRDSAATITLVPNGAADIKFAVELGLSIMMDKPIIALLEPGTHVPAKLVAVADVLIEGSVGDPGTSKRIQEAVTKVLGK